MKYFDIVTRVRNSAGDSQSLQFTNAMLVDWINDGIRECAVDNNLLQKTATSATVANQSQYDLPSDVLKMYSVYVDETKIRNVTLQEWEQSFAAKDSDENSGQPQIFYVWAAKINFYPKPDAVKVLQINYIYNPTDVTYVEEQNGSNPGDWQNQIPATPVGYHARLVDYCLAQVAQQDDDKNLYDIKMEEFRTGISKLKDQPEYDDDLYPFITIATRDMGSNMDWMDFRG